MQSNKTLFYELKESGLFEKLSAADFKWPTAADFEWPADSSFSFKMRLVGTQFYIAANYTAHYDWYLIIDRCEEGKIRRSVWIENFEAVFNSVPNNVKEKLMYLMDLF